MFKNQEQSLSFSKPLKVVKLRKRKSVCANTNSKHLNFRNFQMHSIADNEAKFALTKNMDDQEDILD